MVKASELRIGNFVKVTGNERARKVVGLIGDLAYLEHEVPVEILNQIDNVTGIELTPEWLERFGFKQGDNVTASDSFYEIPVGGSILAINPDNGVVWITRGSNIFNNPALITHIHLLQNLFFSLTGRELELKK